MTEDTNMWAIVELMGHNRIAGKVSEQTIAGQAFLRVDVPKSERQPAYSKFFSGSAIYAITPSNEETVTLAAQRLDVRPVDPWVVPVASPVLVEKIQEPDDEDEDESLF